MLPACRVSDMLSERNCLKTFNELPTEKYYAMIVYTIWLSISLYKLFVDELRGRPNMMCITIPTMLGLTLTFYPSPNPNTNVIKPSLLLVMLSKSPKRMAIWTPLNVHWNSWRFVQVFTVTKIKASPFRCQPYQLTCMDFRCYGSIQDMEFSLQSLKYPFSYVEKILF